MKKTNFKFIKKFYYIFKEKSIKGFRRIIANGGMPSSHAAVVCALAASSVIRNGWGAPVTAVCFALAVIVMIDASGVRYETGKQAKILNKIIVELFSPENTPEIFNTKLKELVGHTPVQVVVGAIFGVFAAIVLAIFMVW